MNLQIPEIDTFGQGLIQHHFSTTYVQLIWSAKISDIFLPLKFLLYCLSILKIC